MKTHRGLVGYLLAAILALIGASLTAPAIAQGTSADDIDGIIVRYRTSQSGDALNARVQAFQSVASGRGLVARYFRQGALGIHVIKLNRKLPVAEAESLAKAVQQADPTVEYAEPDRIMHVAFVPNDPMYSQQWHYFESTAGINLPAAWDLSTGSGVVVAVIDTGYRPHADLVGNILTGYDFISDPGIANDGDGRDSDAQDPGDACSGANSSWHGTHVAGTIAAVSNNSTGVAGVAFNAKIVPARVLGICGGVVSDIADAIVWASGGSVPGVPTNANPARVLNLSLGGLGSCASTYQAAINSARSRNSVVVIAAGNDNVDVSGFQPANCSGVIAVAAVDRTGYKASYSDFGAGVTIAAPGGDTTASSSNGVLSTFNSGTTSPGSDTYAFDQGTSMATPHVAGVAALLLAVNPSLTPDQVAGLIQATSRPFLTGPNTCILKCGTGIVDAYAAVSAATSTFESATVTVGTWSVGTFTARGFSLANTITPGQPAFGSISPSSAGSHPYVAVDDALAVVTSSFTIGVSGFTSDPGSSWFVGGYINGRNLNQAGLFPSYHYSSGTASWSWINTALSSVPLGGTTTLLWAHH